jgi:hypothetical protein
VEEIFEKGGITQEMTGETVNYPSYYNDKALDSDHTPLPSIRHQEFH